MVALFLIIKIKQVTDVVFSTVTSQGDVLIVLATRPGCTRLSPDGSWDWLQPPARA